MSMLAVSGRAWLVVCVWCAFVALAMGVVHNDGGDYMLVIRPILVVLITIVVLLREPDTCRSPFFLCMWLLLQSCPSTAIIGGVFVASSMWYDACNNNNSQDTTANLIVFVLLFLITERYKNVRESVFIVCVILAGLFANTTTYVRIAIFIATWMLQKKLQLPTHVILGACLVVYHGGTGGVTPILLFLETVNALVCDRNHHFSRLGILSAFMSIVLVVALFETLYIIESGLPLPSNNNKASS